MGFFQKKKSRRMKRPRETSLQDDPFSKELARQGEDGRLMRRLYLNPWTNVYKAHLSDESLHD